MPDGDWEGRSDMRCPPRLGRRQQLALGRRSRQRNNFGSYPGYNRRAGRVDAMTVLDPNSPCYRKDTTCRAPTRSGGVGRAEASEQRIVDARVHVDQARRVELLVASAAAARLAGERGCAGSAAHFMFGMRSVSGAPSPARTSMTAVALAFHHLQTASAASGSLEANLWQRYRLRKQFEVQLWHRP